MSEHWGGFTETDIQNFLNARNFEEADILNQKIGVAKRREPQRRFTKKNMTRDRMLNGDKKPINFTLHSHKAKDRLFIPRIPEEEEEEEEEEENKGPILKSQSIEISATKLMENQSEAVMRPNIDALTKFQEKQKFMEEKNKQQKELLQKALAERTRRTKEEAKRLHQIEEELKKMDAILSNDVSIIRNQIEIASHDFMEAQKRYDKAEKEFLEAKLILFNQKEKKEMLTSHLCTIIEQNEIRKAKKLSDLMEKLQLCPVKEKGENKESETQPTTNSP